MSHAKFSNAKYVIPEEKRNIKANICLFLFQIL